jgi:hypothetical protein
VLLVRMLGVSKGNWSQREGEPLMVPSLLCATALAATYCVVPLSWAGPLLVVVKQLAWLVSLDLGSFNQFPAAHSVHLARDIYAFCCLLRCISSAAMLHHDNVGCQGCSTTGL